MRSAKYVQDILLLNEKAGSAVVRVVQSHYNIKFRHRVTYINRHLGEQTSVFMAVDTGSFAEAVGSLGGGGLESGQESGQLQRVLKKKVGQSHFIPAGNDQPTNGKRFHKPVPAVLHLCVTHQHEPDSQTGVLRLPSAVASRGQEGWAPGSLHFCGGEVCRASPSTELCVI